MEFVFDKVGAGRDHLVIGFTIKHNQTIRFGVVRVPWAELLAPEFIDALDRVHRRQMIERWSEVDLGDPLF